ncbi:hypothetical protein PT2222_90271 [Paraburkholderia tropica]
MALVQGIYDLGEPGREAELIATAVDDNHSCLNLFRNVFTSYVSMNPF